MAIKETTSKAASNGLTVSEAVLDHVRHMPMKGNQGGYRNIVGWEKELSGQHVGWAAGSKGG